ncbi:MAG: helix-turn-helix transcriptional regulator [Bacteroidales bacterium]|nr:helix-turn-helix transcriptional regulator [Bacteroidales bacterium]
MVDRILALMKDKNLTPSQFADEIGIQRSGMSHLISGRNKPSLDFIMKVLNRFPDVKVEYLLYGKKETTTDTAEVKRKEDDAPQSVPVTLFDQPEKVADKPEPRVLRQVKRDKTERKAERIVVFYDDRTFREYEPE